MSSTTLNLTPPVYNYLQQLSVREPTAIKALRKATEKETELAHIQIAPEQGQFMAFLVKLMGAKRLIEVGTFTGYSAAWLASALPDDGELIACEVNADNIAIGQPFWEQANLLPKIKLRLGAAAETLDSLLKDGQANTFDFVFIDADKVNYSHYYEQALQLIRPGGIIAIDNTLWGGKVADMSIDDTSTNAIRQLNAQLAEDQRITLSLVPIGDGLTLACKK